jgi:protein tyrosine/serine phosphatase
MSGVEVIASRTVPSARTPLAGRRPYWKICLYGSLAGLTLAAVAETANVMLGRNFHTVVPGQVYRCAQLSPEALDALIQEKGIRTVVNLRGCGIPLPWYAAECRVTHRLNVNQEDIAFSASRLPAVQEVRQLIRVLDRTEYPILLHCRQGADRTGLAAVVVLLLLTDTPFAEARKQLGLRYGHIPVERCGHLDRFFDVYEDWLKRQGMVHSRQNLRCWAENAYCPAECRCTLEPLDLPDRLPSNQPSQIRVRVHNTSLGPWQMRPETNAGVHIGYILMDAQGRGVASARSGLFNGVVAPNQSIDLTLVLPAIKAPGRYRLLVDMVDEQHCWFYQTGSEPLERDLEVQ